MPYKDKTKQLAYQNSWMARRRAVFFADKRCVKCGSTEDLQLDHIEPRKKVSHRIWSWKKELRDRELSKCQVLCGECHREKTTEDKQWREHGTPSEYRNHGCRCADCTQANTLAKRRVRAKARSTKP